MPLLHQAGVDGFVLLVTAGDRDWHGTRVQRPARAGGWRAPTRRSAHQRAKPRHDTGPSPCVGPIVAGGRPSWSIACVLLIGTGLLLRSLVSLLDGDFGFRPAETVVMTLTRRSRPDSRTDHGDPDAGPSASRRTGHRRGRWVDRRVASRSEPIVERRRARPVRMVLASSPPRSPTSLVPDTSTRWA